MPSNWNADRHLNVFVLGPMPSPGSLDSSCRIIKNALDNLLGETGLQEVLKAAGTTDFKVEIPEEQHHGDITGGIFQKLDVADLVVVNITPKDGVAGAFSPNVFYELGLVHALGIPYFLVSLEGGQIPFYFKNNRVHFVPDFKADSLKNALRGPLKEFLEGDSDADFSANPITKFYSLPIVDISAAVGVATGYFQNLVRRALLENGFIGRDSKTFKHLIVCRPEDIIAHSFGVDKAELDALVERELGIRVEQRDLPMIEGFDKRGLSGHFVRNVMIDLPTAAYTLAQSPRFRSLKQRVLKAGRARTTAETDRIFRQASEKLLDQFETGLKYLVDQEEGIRKSALSFCSFRELPGELRRLIAD